MIFQRHRPIILCLLTALVVTATARADDAARREHEQELRGRIVELIEELGSDRYAVRERAQTELAQLGTAAFDDLLEARHHADVEVAQRAEYLIRRMSIELISQDDSHEVQQILSSYAALSDEERIRRMGLLARLELGQGVAPLCRLARFDESERLSKEAALLLLEQLPPPTLPERVELAATIESTIQFSRRPAADWLRTYAGTLRDPQSALPEWARITEHQWEEYENDSQEQQRESLVRLLRWQVDLLREHGQHGQAESAMEKLLTAVEPSQPALLETVDWFIDRQAWSLVDQAHQRFGDLWQQDPELIYRLAEVRREQDRPEESEQLAAVALAIDPGSLEDHSLLAWKLSQRGLFDWAESEYRQVLDQTDVGTDMDLRQRLFLSDMLHDNLRELEAAQALQPAVDAFRDRNGVGSIRSRMHYFFAVHFAEIGDRQSEIEHLDVAITNDPTSLDVIIALYRLPEQDEARRERTLQYLESAKGQLWRKVDNHEEVVRQIFGQRANPYREDLAKFCNEYAWLVSNTEGDYERALECSRRSLELMPDQPGYLDTLGRCYFALDDLENAVRFQRRAHELQPHSGQIRRQLEEFEQALAQEEAEAD